MPFGKKPDAGGATIDFDAVYRELIAPAIDEAGLEPLRADHEMTGGIIHKPMFERLILCEYAVADLTTANANVFYELGLRHAVRPASTVLIFGEGSRLPFDVALLRALPYKLNAAGAPENTAEDKRNLVSRLVEARNSANDDPKALVDSPIYQLVENYPDIDRTKTDVFRESVRYSVEMKARLAEARSKGTEDAKKGLEALRAIEAEFADIKDVESGVVVDLFLSYRAVKGWAEMIALVAKMSRPLAATVMVQEQLALALNRAGQGERAEQVALDVLAKHGASSETYGILGRIYKDRWDAAVEADKTAVKEGKPPKNKFLARGLLDKAAEAYLRGFEADWRDAYPGVNAVTLMELKEPPDARREQLNPVVSYAVERRIASGKPDYWDFASRLELAVLVKDEERAVNALGDALVAVREVWEPESTARNLRLIREARERRQETLSWANEIEDELNRRAQ
ncbi:MAG TPA: TRAFs-binding domain-containing protein, partial [Pyrinomonadaceae bacterium]|nr:TRAFs-binding domain-containing protein [Pyrinomonadaceae bacterium]